MWGKRKQGASKPWKSGNTGELRLSYTPCALSGPLSLSLQNLPQSPRETQEHHRTKPQSWGVPSRAAVWLVSPFSREDPLSEERGNTEHLNPQFLCPHARAHTRTRAHTHTHTRARTHTHTPSEALQHPSAEGEGAIRSSAPGNCDGESPGCTGPPAMMSRSLRSHPLWPFTGFLAPLLQRSEVTAVAPIYGARPRATQCAGCFLYYF